jgi:hypothetical protein
MENALIGGFRLAGGTDQPVGLDHGMALFRLRAQEEADGDEGGAEQQAHDHDTSVGLPVGGVKRCGHKGKDQNFLSSP